MNSHISLSSISDSMEKMWVTGKKEYSTTIYLASLEGFSATQNRAMP